MNYWLNEFQHELQLLIDPIRSALLTIIIVIVLFWILCGIIGASINKYKGGGPFIGFFAGLLFGPLGIALTMLAPYKPNDLINANPQRRQWFTNQMKVNTDPKREGNDKTYTPALQGKEREELADKLDERTK